MGVILVIIGLISGISVTSTANQHKAIIDSGVKAEGTVTDVRIEIRRGTSGTGNSSSTKDKSTKTTVVSFTAENSKTYNTQFTEKYKGLKSNVTAEEQEDMGKTMTVFYDSSNPENSVIEGKEVSVGLGYILGGGFLFFGLFIVIACTIQLKKKKKEAV